MKQNDLVHGYRVVTEPTNAGGGRCVWAFAEKDGRQYFLKEFLTPVRPVPGVGSAARREALEKLCRQFEERHHRIMEKLRPDMPGGGHLVLAEDFFSEGVSYYKVTQRIDTSTLERPQLLEARQKCILLKSLAVSLRLLHHIGVVHGDLKPDNVLVQKMPGNAFHIAKLIDFDDAYLSGNPPAPEDVAGDPRYGAPEWRRYLQQDEGTAPEALTCAVDIFALGLMTHEFMTGALPRHDPGFGAPADAVNAGEPLDLDHRLTDGMTSLIRSMLDLVPKRRPDIDAVLSALADPAVCELVHRRPGSGGDVAGTPSAAPKPVPGPAAPATANRLLISTRPSSPPPSADRKAPGAPEPAPEPGTSRIQISLRKPRP